MDGVGSTYRSARKPVDPAQDAVAPQPSSTLTSTDNRAPLSDWNLITEKPSAPIAVELYYANMVFRDNNGNPVDWTKEPYRDERRELGFWDGKTFCQNGTGHSVFEEWRDPTEMPTHWRECAPPPL